MVTDKLSFNLRGRGERMVIIRNDRKCILTSIGAISQTEGCHDVTSGHLWSTHCHRHHIPKYSTHRYSGAFSTHVG